MGVPALEYRDKHARPTEYGLTMEYAQNGVWAFPLRIESLVMQGT
jgi:hypothetical protein